MTNEIKEAITEALELVYTKVLIKEELFKAINEDKDKKEPKKWIKINNNPIPIFGDGKEEIQDWLEDKNEDNSKKNFPKNVDLTTLKPVNFTWEEFNKYKDKDEVIKFYNKHIKGNSLTHKDKRVGKVRFLDIGLDETKYQNRKRNYYILTKIPEIISNSEYDRTEPPKHEHKDKNLKQFHILYGKIKLPSKEQALIIYIAEDNQGNKYYFYKPIQTIKIKEPRN